MIITGIMSVLRIPYFSVMGILFCFLWLLIMIKQRNDGFNPCARGIILIFFCSVTFVLIADEGLVVIDWWVALLPLQIIILLIMIIVLAILLLSFK